MCSGQGLAIVRAQADKVEKRKIESYPREKDCVITIEDNFGAPSLDCAANSTGNKICIYKFPSCLGDPLHQQLYIPRAVSIGPYHNQTAPLQNMPQQKSLQKMEQHKSRVLRQVLNRTNQDEKLLIDSMREIEVRTRACYEERSDLPSDKYVEMMLLDGCFVLEILQGISVSDGFEKLGYAPDDPIFSRKGTIYSILQDMLMLGNQIPLFVLEKLLGFQNVGRECNTVFDTLFGLQRAVMHTSIPPSRPRDSQSDQLSLHFLDVFRKWVLQEGPKPVVVEDGQREHLKYSATELRNAGIKVEKGNTEELWNIKFEKGTLYIPRIRIDDGFKLIFFNLIAFEEHHLGFDHHITSYLAFLDDLIDSHEDVRFLKNQGIIEHMVGSDAEVVAIINYLGRGIYSGIEDSYLSHLSWQINEYSNQKRHTCSAGLMGRYFENPLAVICSVFAAVSFLMTVAQSSYAFISYHWPTN